MGIGVSVFLIALGAILAFAVSVEAQGFSINTIGIILMVAGAIGLLASMLIFGGDRGAAGGRRRTVVREDDVV
jgi:hypothetical protein